MHKRLWTLIERGFQPERLNHYETLFTIGNGYLGTRGSFEENDQPQGIAGTLIHGIYDHAAGMLVPELVNAPNWLPIHITVDGTPFTLVNDRPDNLRPVNGALLGYERALHLDRGVLNRDILFRAASGSVVRINFERFASLSDIHIMAQRVRVIAVDGSPTITVRFGLDADSTNTGVNHWHPTFTSATQEGVIGFERMTGQLNYRVGIAATVTDPRAAIEGRDGLHPALVVSATLAPETSVTFDKLTAIYTNRDVANPLETATAVVVAAAQQGYDALLALHESEWARYWDTSDIVIEGDDECQFATRFTQYHLLIAAPRHDENVSIGAKTLSGLGYKGHVFWDTELFALPPLLLSHPNMARNLLLYRYHRLAGARQKAHENGFAGAMFPWESTDTGIETTPKWSDPQPDGSLIRIWTGDSEQHIATDIAYAVWQFWRWTGDNNFMTRYGAEILLDTAVFWGSRVEAKNGRYEISQQIGPDEYHENIDNSVFTNRMVMWHLEKALVLLDWLQRHAKADYKRLVEALKITPERLENWRDIIARMFIPFDSEKQLHIQFPGFFDMEYIPVPNYQPRTTSVQAILGHTRSIQTQVIKQADVVMLMALLGDELTSDEQIKRNNWDTYFPRTDHGSSLSPAIHAWVAAGLGLIETAYDQFYHAAHIDLQDNKGNVRDGMHAAACGGVYQALIFGFCGLHINADGDIAVAPKLPEHWRSVSFSVIYRGEKRSFTVRNPR